MDIFTRAFETLYATRATVRGVIRLSGRDEISKCITSGIGETRQDTEEGQMDAIAGAVRFLSSDEPARGGLENGKTIELKHAGDSNFKKFRIAARTQQAGITTLTLEAEFA